MAAGPGVGAEDVGDTLNGGAGNDRLVGGAGADILNEGADIDTVGYAIDLRDVGAQSKRNVDGHRRCGRYGHANRR